jgi:transglutaminase-like putative cysteine protease
MNHRLTIAAALAVILASTSEWVLINGAGWLAASIGAVIAVALAGTVTRLAPTQATIGATVLATLACVPLLLDRSLLVKLAGLIVIGCCAASASRVRMLRPVADLVTYLSALLLYLNLTMSSGKSFALLVPTGRSLHHLVTLVNQGRVAATHSPPVSSGAGVILLTAASIGLAAIVVDVVAVRLRKPAIAGLPLLVIYMAPIATAAKTGGPSGIFTFLLAAIGYLGLLASDGRHRLGGWGRIVTVWHYAGEDDRLGGADIRGLAATGRRIGFAAICAAVIAPLLLPTLNLHHLFGHGSGGDKVVSAGLPTPIDQMHGLLNQSTVEPVLSYTSNSKAGTYLQVYVLNYNPRQHDWTVVDPNPSVKLNKSDPLPPPGLVPTTDTSVQSATIKLGHVGPSYGYNFPVFFLPVPYWPSELNVPGSWSESKNTLMVYSGVANHSGMRYTVWYNQPVLTKALEALPESVPKSLRSYLYYRSSAKAQLTAIARKITMKAKTPFAKAVALENFFQSGQFTYTLHTDLPNTGQGLLDFIQTVKQGFCEQFAFAMAVLARLVGIPSRIAIGYTGGTEHANGVWRVTTADAHSWPELYFPRIGWLRFEPTPGGARGQGTASQPSYAIAAPGGPPIINIKPGKQTGTTPNTGIDKSGAHVRAPEPGAVGNAPPVKSSASRSHVPLEQILLAFLALLVLGAAVPGTARVVARRRRWRAASDDISLATAAWQEVCADLDDLGLDRRLSESPRATARRIGADANIDEGARQAISRIATVVERCRYAPVPASAAGIKSDVSQVRRSLARSVGIMQRVRARLIPASVVGPILTATQRSVGQRTGLVPSPIQG